MSIKQAVLVLVVVGGVLGAVFVFTENKSVPHYLDDSPSLNREYWKHTIQKEGPHSAYQHFLEKNAKTSEINQHTATHVIGELFFELEGKEGIQYCDSSFGFGCYHGLFGVALASEGIPAIAEFDKLCLEIYGPLGTGCQHGIGHGVMEFVGGDRVSEALTLCEKTTQTTKLLGCTSGVFMEYFTPLAGIGGFERPQPREIDFNNPHAPCDSVDASFQESCYFELGQWYGSRLMGDYDEQASLCSTISDIAYRNRCYMGVGLISAPLSVYDKETVLATCKAMGLGEGPCRAGGAWSFFSNPRTRSEAHSICENADAQKQNICIGLADLTEGQHSGNEL